MSACTKSVSDASQSSDSQKSREYRSEYKRTQDFIDSASFTDDDVEIIKKRGIPVELIGAGYTIQPPDQTGLEMIRMAKDIEPTNPVAWAALLYKELELFGDGSSPVIEDAVIQGDLDEFEKVDTNNSLPVFLRAYLYSVTNDLSKASEEMKNASQKKVFSSHVLEIKRYAIEAGESVGHSPLAARMLAINGYWQNLFLFFKLADSLLEYELADRETIEACFDMGKQIEKEGKAIIEQLVGMAIQSRSLLRLTGNKESEELKSIEERQDIILDIHNMSKQIDFEQVKENRLIRFYDDMYTLGEGEAIKRLYSELKEDQGAEN